MGTVQQHYDRLLAPVYSWTLGDFDARVASSEALFRGLGLERPGGRALDVGCGTGVQTLALSRLGLAVTGVDFSETMLAEYRRRTADVGAVGRFADITAFDVDLAFDVAVCLGDTVSHLPSWDAVRAMFARVHAALRPGGAFVLASRDHSRIYEGDARFLLIRSDATGALVCFLEDCGSQVRVTDLLFRTAGAPPLEVGSYMKLRVGPDSLSTELAAAGFTIAEHRVEAGIHVFSTLATRSPR